jgi:hypothetical protein
MLEVASAPDRSAGGHAEADGGDVLDHANHQASIGCPSADASSSFGSTVHTCEYAFMPLGLSAFVLL